MEENKTIAYETFSCMRGELNIRGRIYGDTGEKGQVVIMAHGFLGTQKMCEDYAILLSEKGNICVTFDFCGGGSESVSDGKTEDMTVFTECEDLMAVITYMEGQSFTDRISLLGCSQGGLVAAMIAKKIPDRINKLILLYPAFGIADHARKGRIMFYRFDPDNIPDILGTYPMKVGGDYARTIQDLDIFSEIGGFRGPVLYLQGVKDRIVDVRYARKANLLYPNCTYHEIEGGRHIFKGKAEEEAREWIAGFMA